MAYKTKRPLRVLVMLDKDLIPPKTIEEPPKDGTPPWQLEYDVITNLEKMGHQVIPVGVDDDLRVIRRGIEEHKPHIVFNLLVEFLGYTLFEPHIVSYLELLKQPYTGCNPRGLVFAHDKALTKKILAFHRIRVPQFAVFELNRKVRRPKRLPFPLFVKSLGEEGSTGISQASIINDDAALIERVDFIHRQTNAAAAVEQYIDGREIYVAVMGNRRLKAYTPWELTFEKLPPGSAAIATSRLKWNRAYQKKVGLVCKPADLPAEKLTELDRLSKRIYRILNLSGYARLDFRLSPEGKLYLLEANPNPDISVGEDFPDAAAHCGVSYGEMLQKIITLGQSYQPMS